MMKRKSNGAVIWLLVGLLALFFAVPAPAADYCDMAREVAARAVKTFPADQEKGIRLFIKALKLCDRPLYNYNLGIAYFQYGNPAEAEKYLVRAVAGDDVRAKWLNDCAAVIIFRGGKGQKALKLAEKAWKRAANDEQIKPAIAATLAEARLQAGKGLAALKGITAARRQWPDDQQVKTAAGRIESAYLRAGLALLTRGEQKKGFAVLEQGAEYSPLAAATLCQAWSRAGKGQKSLAAAARWRQRYPRRLAGIWDEVVAGECDRLCRRFSAGERAPAMQQAKLLHERYASDQELKKTYDKLFEAYINDDATIAVAPRQSRPAATQNAGELDVKAALDAAFGGGRAAKADRRPVELVAAVDQDKNIRRGRRRPHGLAVVIGNRDYHRYGHGLPNVRYAGRDAVVMKKYLVRTM
ncbi:MAG: hypothetical protein JRJ56_08815, partial [Deltaproteobacteria bacterium]|nr:hypothetical protein [Deltaproteobacteria bacterium]